MVLLCPGWQVRRAKAQKGQPSRPEHTGKAIENFGMLISWNVNDRVVRAHRVEGRISERQCDEVRTYPTPSGHVLSGEAELHFGKVDSDDFDTSSKLLGNGDPRPATRVKDARPRWETDDQIIQQRNVRRIATTRREVSRCNAIERLADLGFGIHGS